MTHASRIFIPLPSMPARSTPRHSSAVPTRHPSLCHYLHRKRTVRIAHPIGSSLLGFYLRSPGIFVIVPLLLANHFPRLSQYAELYDILFDLC